MALMIYMPDARIEAGRKCGDPTINLLLQDLRKRTGEDWIVDIYATEYKRWFRKPEICIEYRLCCNTGHGDVQVFTELGYAFISMTTDYRMLALISKEMVLNFINGYLIALDTEERKHVAVD